MCLYIVPNLQFLHGIRAFTLSSSKELRRYQYSTSNCIQHPLPLWRRAWIELTSIPPSLYLCMFNIASPWLQQKLSMDSSSSIIPTPFNYHEWKAKIGISLRSKGLYRVSLDLENDPNAIVEKANWSNRFEWSLWISLSLNFSWSSFFISMVWPIQKNYGPNLRLSLQYKMR